MATLSNLLNNLSNQKTDWSNPANYRSPDYHGTIGMQPSVINPVDSTGNYTRTIDQVLNSASGGSSTSTPGTSQSGSTSTSGTPGTYVRSGGSGGGSSRGGFGPSVEQIAAQQAAAEAAAKEKAAQEKAAQEQLLANQQAQVQRNQAILQNTQNLNTYKPVLGPVITGVTGEKYYTVSAGQRFNTLEEAQRTQAWLDAQGFSYNERPAVGNYNVRKAAADYYNSQISSQPAQQVQQTATQTETKGTQTDLIRKLSTNNNTSTGLNLNSNTGFTLNKTNYDQSSILITPKPKPAEKNDYTGASIYPYFDITMAAPQISAQDEATAARTKEALAEEERRMKQNPGGILTANDRQIVQTIQAGGGILYPYVEGIKQSSAELEQKAKDNNYNDILGTGTIIAASYGAGYIGGLTNFVDKAIPLRPGLGGPVIKSDYLTTNPVSEFAIGTGQLISDPVGVGGQMVGEIASNPLYQVPKLLGELEAFNKTTGRILRPVETAGGRIINNAYNKGVITLENWENAGKHTQTFIGDDYLLKTAKGNEYALVQNIRKNPLQGDLSLQKLKESVKLGLDKPSKTTHVTGAFNVLENEKYLLTGSPQPHWGGVKNTNFYNSIPLESGTPVVALKFGVDLVKKAPIYEENAEIVLRRPRNISFLNVDKVYDLGIDELNNIMRDIETGNKANVVKKINAPELGGKKLIQPENLINYSREPQVGIQAQDIKPWGQKQAGSVLKTGEKIESIRFYNKMDIAPGWLKNIAEENSLASGAATKAVNFLEKNKPLNIIWDKSGIGREWKKIDVIGATYARPPGRPPIQREVDIRERPTLINVQNNKALVGIDSKTGEYLLIGGGSDKFLGEGRIGLNATRWKLEDPKIGVMKETLQETSVEPKNLKRVLTTKDYFSPEYTFRSSGYKGRQLIEYRVKDRLIPFEGKVDATKIKNMQGFENTTVDFVDVEKLMKSKKFNKGHKEVLADYLKREGKLTEEPVIKQPKVKKYKYKTKLYEEAYSGRNYYSLLEDLPKSALSYSKGAIKYRQPEKIPYYPYQQEAYKPKYPIVPQYIQEPTPVEPRPLEYITPGSIYEPPAYPTTRYPGPNYPGPRYEPPKYPKTGYPGSPTIPPRSPPLVPPMEPKGKDSSGNYARSYDLYVRKGIGAPKKGQIGMELIAKNMPRGSAMNTALSIADRYSQRTAVLRPSMKTPTIPDEPVNSILLNKFRPLKPKSKIPRQKQDLVFVEKSKFAIDSADERKEIPYKGQKALKQKSMFGNFGGMRI